MGVVGESLLSPTLSSPAVAWSHAIHANNAEGREGHGMDMVGTRVEWTESKQHCGTEAHPRPIHFQPPSCVVHYWPDCSPF